MAVKTRATEIDEATVEPGDAGTSDGAEDTESVEDTGPVEDSEASSNHSELRHVGTRWRRVLAYGVVPVLALLLAMAGGYVKWRGSTVHDSQLSGAQAVQAATEGTIAMLSYRPDTVERDLGAARDRLSGDFKDAYTSLVHDVVTPGSRQKQISAVASVPAAASVSASYEHAVVLLFVNQTVTMGSDPPTNTASRVRVTLDKVHDRWLISRFDPL